MVTPEPAHSLAAAAVLTNKPAPMMAPMPRAMSDHMPRVFFKLCSPEAASANILLSDFLLNNSDMVAYCFLKLTTFRDKIQTTPKSQ